MTSMWANRGRGCKPRPPAVLTRVVADRRLEEACVPNTRCSVAHAEAAPVERRVTEQPRGRSFPEPPIVDRRPEPARERFQSGAVQSVLGLHAASVALAPKLPREIH